MTTPIPSDRAMGRIFSSPRSVVAWALVGYAALYLLFTLIIWLVGDGSFSGRSRDAGFDNLLVMAMPVVAVVLASYVGSVLADAKLIATIAVIEYAIALFFGLVTLLVGLGTVFDNVNDGNDVVYALNYLVMGVANLALIAAAGYVAWRAFTGMGGRISMSRATPAA